MSNQDVVFRVSKIKTQLNSYYLQIGADSGILEKRFYFPDTGILPAIGSEDYSLLQNTLKQYLREMFSQSWRRTKVERPNLTFKFIFGDKYILTGVTPKEGIVPTGYSELAIPLNESEIIFIQNCIPENY